MAGVPVSNFPAELGSSSELAKVLTAALPGKLSLPGSEQFDANNGSYYSAFENELVPAVIARPTSAEDVATLIKTLKPLLLGQPSGSGPKLAIRGGGHTPQAGAANVQDGVTLDLRGLKGVTLSEDKTTVSIGAGETWDKVYEVLAAEGLTVTGGRVPVIGVTGFLLGGGLSYFANARGFGVDSVTNFELVLASGEVVQANASANADLYRAVQGGSNNFGVVTRLDMATLPLADKMWGGLVYATINNLSTSHQALYDYVTAEDVDEGTHMQTIAAYNMGFDVVGANLYHTEGVVDPPSFKGLLEMEGKIEQFSTLRRDTHHSFCQEQTSLTAMGKRQFFITTTIRPSVELFDAVYARFHADVDAMKDSVADIVLGLVFQPVTRTMLLNSCRQRQADGAGFNSQGLKAEDGPLIIVLVSSSWAKPSDDDRVIKTAEKMIGDIQALAEERKLGHRYIFPNYAWQGQDVMKGYGEERLAELKSARGKWDPEGFFQTVVTGCFKLGQ